MNLILRGPKVGVSKSKSQSQGTNKISLVLVVSLRLVKSCILPHLPLCRKPLGEIKRLFSDADEIVGEMCGLIGEQIQEKEEQFTQAAAPARVQR